MSDELHRKDSPDSARGWLKHVSALAVLGIGFGWYWLGTNSPGHDGALMMGVVVTFIGLAGWFTAMWPIGNK